ncbi:MAG TPA: peptide chain release factor N(5)-glutamine methyltransferase [Geminicoccaceae bacterium]|nr:peptide chain release factor N(5)-glutamine methyltransferase [Geminicoccaceae bacterium]
MPRPAEPGPTLAPLASAGAATLRRAGVEDALADARLLLGRATGRSRERLAADPEARPGPVELAAFLALLERRAQREPMAYILGEREFWGAAFAVAPGALIPRPETETVIEAALDALPDRAAPLRLLDLGTGSGCLLLTLLHLYPEALGTGTDLDARALAVARANARRLGVGERARLRRTSWGQRLRGPFELIVANPPYVTLDELAGLAPEVRDFEPHTALAAGADGLDAYRALAPDAARLLAPEGRLVLEIGRDQGNRVAAVLAAQGLAVERRLPDLAGIERCLVARRAQDRARAPRGRRDSRGVELGDVGDRNGCRHAISRCSRGISALACTSRRCRHAASQAGTSAAGIGRANR